MKLASAAGLAPARARLKGVTLDYFAFADVCSRIGANEKRRNAEGMLPKHLVGARSP